tara:strand:- start:236 stop:682 length:447 start_codon:yes stop_codon:yes gene_type:complete
MINLGIYIKDLSNTQLLHAVQSEIAKAKSDGDISDASIFFDDIGPIDIKIDAGIFNSTDLWHFNGHLITTCLETLLKSITIVNNMHLYYCFDTRSNYDTLIMLRTIIKDNISTIAFDNDSAMNFYRLTGKKPISICDKFSGVVKTIIG